MTASGTRLCEIFFYFMYKNAAAILIAAAFVLFIGVTLCLERSSSACDRYSGLHIILTAFFLKSNSHSFFLKSEYLAKIGFALFAPQSDSTSNMEPQSFV